MQKVITFLLAALSAFIVKSQSVDFSYITGGITCAPVTVTFTDISTGGIITKRTWDFGDGLGTASSTLANPLIETGRNYSDAGKYTVTLTVEFEDNSRKSISHTINIHPSPIADFTASTYAGCKKLPVSFTDASTTTEGTITQWSWDFGAGNSTVKNPAFTYTGNGKYNVSLITYNNFGCKSNVATKEINVYDNAIPSFTIDKMKDCIDPADFTFTNTTTGTGDKTYQWSFGDGTQIETLENPTHTYAAGQYNVSLHVVNGTNCSNRTNPTTVYVGTPQVNNMILPLESCVGSSVTFSASVTPSSFINNTYKWTFSDGSFYSGPSNSKTFTSPGTYSVTLQVINGAGCISRPVVKEITIKPSPVANFTVDKDILCTAPFTAEFTNTGSSGSSYNYDWDFGDGTVHATTEKPTHTYTTETWQTVTLKVTDPALACSTSKSFSYIKTGTPVITLNVTPVTGCKPVKVMATATTSKINDAIQNYIWDFGDGTITTTIPTALFTYITGGPKTIQVKVVTEACKASSLLSQVFVNDICNDDGSSSSTGAGSGGFTFQSGSCGSKSTITLKDDYSALTINNSETIEWDFGDGTVINASPVSQNVTHTYNGGGTRNYTITVKRKNTITGDITSDTKNITIIDEEANFTVSAMNTCTEKQITFKTQGIKGEYIKTYSWDWGDGSNKKVITNPNYSAAELGQTTHLYSAPESYTVTLTITDKFGCTNSRTLLDPIVIKGPTADFSGIDLVSCKEENFTKTFSETSQSNGTVPIVKWQWYIDNILVQTYDNTRPNTPVLLSFTNAANTYKDYNIKLVVTDKEGCISAPKTLLNYIKSYWPKAIFTADKVLTCENRNIYFTNSSKGKSLKYAWNYGDDLTSTTAGSHYHNYLADKEYTVSLTVNETALPTCTDILTQSKYIKIVKPTAAFEVGSLAECAPISVNFVNKSTYSTSYSWDFGDGGTGSTDENPSGHIYKAGGDYRVKLNITGTSGCTDIKDTVIHIKGPTGALSYTDIAGCVPFNFTAAVTGTNINNFAWDFKDGTLLQTESSVNTLTHLYETSGKYKPNVILSSSDGCTYTLQMQPDEEIIVDEILAAFEVDKSVFCNEADVTFSNKTTVAEFSSVVNYLWDFGDDNTSNTGTPDLYHYAKPKTYTATLSAESKYGCKSTSKSIFIAVNASPGVTISGDDLVCLLPQGPLLNYTSNINSIDDIKSYQWKIGDMVVGTDPALSLDYRITGKHVLSLTVTTGNDCDSTVTKNIIIDSVRSAFTIDQNKFCGQAEPLFTNTSTVAATSSIIDHLWNFGEGNTSSLQSTTHIYNLEGTYNVSLHTVSATGCTSDTTLPDAVIIYKKPQLSLTGPDEICIHKKADFLLEEISEDQIISASWNINDDPVTGTLEGMHSTFDIPDNYNVKYKIATLYGCKDSAEKIIIVHSNPIVQITSDITICKGETLQLSASGGTNYLWTGKYFTDATTKASTTISPLADTKYMAVVTNEFGCSTLDSVLVSVDIPVSLTVTNDVSICEGQSQQLQAAGNTSNFTWLPVAGLSNPNIANPIASPDITTAYIVTGISNNICADDIAQVTVTVNPIPVINMSRDTTVASGTEVVLQANASNNIAQYLWSPATGLSCTNCPDPAFTANNDITYTLQVSTEAECSIEQSIKIHVLCNEGAIYIPSAFTPNNDGKNDVFYVMGYGIKLIKSFRIYNRLGNLVFSKQNISANDRTVGWTGIIKGQPVNESAAYVYIVEAICNEGNPIFLKGTVVLIKN